MPRKQDPAIAVVDYFQSAPIDAAKSTLAIANAIVRKRSPETTKKKAATPRKSGPGPAPAMVGE